MRNKPDSTDGTSSAERAELSALRQKAVDLALINALNDASNRGASLADIIDLLGKETMRIFSSNGVTVYLLSEDKKMLRLQNFALRKGTIPKIEKLLGFEIPEISLPLTPGGHYTRIIHDAKPLTTQSL
jgi:hypothetical protein